MTDKSAKTYNPTVSLTHRCNLNCVYCYQHHDSGRMTFDTAKKVVDKIFAERPIDCTGIKVGFIGGEPLLEFELMKQLCEYAWQTHHEIPYLMYATTNGTLLTQEMKEWFVKNLKRFQLGLSLDGAKRTQDLNRSNSFDKIDIPFFQKYYLGQGVKMTLSEHSLETLSDDIIFIHKLGFDVKGANLAEGEFNWNQEKYLPVVARELKKLVNFYVENPDVKVCQFFDKNLALCESQNRTKKKYCGTGTTAVFFDIDGCEYLCPFITPMTFSEEEIAGIKKTDFTDAENFVDDECFKNCYAYPLCPSCAGSNYKLCGTFSKHERGKCRITKLIALFAAELYAQRIYRKQVQYDDAKLFHTIEAIKKIKALYFDEFKEYIEP